MAKGPQICEPFGRFNPDQTMMLTVVPVAIAADAVAICASAEADAATAGAAAGTLTGCWLCHVASAVLEPIDPTEMLMIDLLSANPCRP